MIKFSIYHCFDIVKFATYTKLYLKLNCHVDMGDGVSPFSSKNVIPHCMILSKSTLHLNNWYWKSAAFLNSPIGRATTPGNSVSCYKNKYKVIAIFIKTIHASC